MAGIGPYAADAHQSERKEQAQHEERNAFHQVLRTMLPIKLKGRTGESMFEPAAKREQHRACHCGKVKPGLALDQLDLVAVRVLEEGDSSGAPIVAALSR